MRPVVLGNSTAAIAAIEAIHLQDPAISPILISDEALPPYTPMVLVSAAEGKISEGDLFFRDADVYRRNNVEAKLGKKALLVDSEKRIVTLEDGEAIPFSKLLIAAGAEPLLPPITGLLHARAVTIRRMADARLLKEKMRAAKSACIIGGGLIGMEAAQCLITNGIPTNVLELMPQILPAYFDPEAASIIQRAFEARGARFFLGSGDISIQSPKGSGGKRVRIGGQVALNADLIVAATGVSPRTNLVEGTKIKIGRGVLVDDSMETSVPGIYAAGDIAEAPDFFSGKNSLNPILPAAAEQGKVAGINMAGGQAKYEGNLKMNIFNFFGRVAFSVGDVEPVAGDDLIIIRRSSDEYGKIIMRRGKLMGCLFVNMGLEPGIIRAMMGSREDFSEHRARFADDLKVFSRVWMMKRRMEGIGHRRRFSSLGKRASVSESIPMPRGLAGPACEL